MSSESLARHPATLIPFGSVPGRNATASLPAPVTPIVGREQEIATIGTLIRNPEVRLVTLTGPGGVGKTRLALHIATEATTNFSDEVAFVDLTAIREPELVALHIAQALDVRYQDGRPALALLKAALHPREMLLVLDNFEHVIDASPMVSELLQAWSRLTILVTSRAVLHLSGEHVVPVQPLSLPGSDVHSPPEHVHGASELTSSPPDLLRFDAVRLFVERSQAVNPTFALTVRNAVTIAAICARLDGLPLAIELAAARSVLFSPEALLARLDRRLPLLTAGPRDLPDRQRTMRDAIAWSYDLLDPAEQAVLRRLAVFVGGCSLEAAQPVCAGSEDAESDVAVTIESLIRQSLVQVNAVTEDVEPSRLTMLETVREFAAEQLETRGEAQGTERRHAMYYLSLATKAEPAFWGDATVEDHKATTDEPGNLRAGLTWAIEHEETDLALKLASAVFDPSLLLYAHHLIRTDPRDHLAWARRALALPGGSAAHRVAALTKAAWLAQTEGDLTEGQSLAEEALRIARDHGDQLGTATATFVLGRAAFRAGDLSVARHWLTDALARFQTLDAPGRAAWTQCILASVDCRAAADAGNKPSDLSRAAELCDAALVTFRATSHGPGITRALHGRATVAYYQRDYSRALTLLDDVLSHAWEQRLTVRHFLENIAHVAGRTGRPELAARLYGAASEERRRFGNEVLPVRDAELALGMAPAREALGEAAFSAKMVEGRAMPREQAVAEALTFAATDHTFSRVALTPRERDILPLLAEGKTARQIGDALYLSHRTIEHHTANLATKLEVRTRAEVVDAARAAGLLPPQPDRDQVARPSN